MARSLIPLLGLLVLTAHSKAADAPAVREFRTQKVGEVAYIHLKLETPRRMLSDAETGGRWRPWGGREPLLQPRLVSPDGKVTHLYQRQAVQQGRFRPEDDPRAPVRDDKPGQDQPPMPRQPVAVDGLEFVGKTQATGEIKLTLLYPRQSRLGRILPGSRRNFADQVRWEEATLSLDLTKAKEVAPPAEATVRRAGPAPKKPTEHPVRDDLEGLWAAAQVEALATLSGEVSDFGFYSLASEATARKYFVPALVTQQGRGNEGWRNPARRVNVLDGDLHGLYDTTTGAAAIAESLALRRMAGVFGSDDQKRTVDIKTVQGIDIDEHPWEKMMAGKKPADEPLARMIPHDNYYVSFKSMNSFNELSDLLDEWGTGLNTAWQATSRDHRLKQRYEQQLCLRSTSLGRTLGPLVIKSVVLTGSDAYLREGSDVTIIFHVTKPGLFLAGVEGFLKEARQKFGEALKESKSTHLEIPIESFVTPLREVSCHRAAFDDTIVYSNSPAGLRRVLDCYKGKSKRLSEVLDFQYMRTIFRADDKSEDGFVFLSDAFIRQLVGPTSKIKEKRRIEALTSLYMITHGALFTAWETGKLPVAHRDVLAGANLKPQEVPMPEGKPAAWDAARQVALSDAYNNIHFATPLVELPIDKVTEGEARQYDQFRREYLGLWRQYFDPIGMRFSLKEGQIKLDTYILPLVQNSQYNELRRVTGGGTVSLDVNAIGPSTILQYMMHLSPAVQRREELLGFGRGRGEMDLGTLLAWGLDPIGKWAMIRLDDSPVYGKLLEMMERAERSENIDTEDIARQVFEMPLVVGIDVKNPLTFGVTLAAFRLSVLKSLPGGVTWEPLEKPYKEVPIVCIKPSLAALRPFLVERERPGRKAFEPAIYYAMLDGAFYLTLNEKMLHDLIDQAESRKKGEAKTVEVNSSLYMSPAAAKVASELVRRYLENQIQEQTLVNEPIWYALYRCGVVREKEKAALTAYQYLGYVPASPDGSPYGYDAAKDEVSNERHGSLRKPTLRRTLAEGSPLARVLEQVKLARADLRFREDGIHTVLTVERQKPSK